MGLVEMNDDYLIWSHEHSAWWHGGSLGYTPHLDLAGRFTRDEALRICFRAMPGAGARLNELPVRAEDMRFLCDRFDGAFPKIPRPWR